MQKLLACCAAEINIVKYVWCYVLHLQFPDVICKYNSVMVSCSALAFMWKSRSWNAFLLFILFTTFIKDARRKRRCVIQDMSNFIVLIQFVDNGAKLRRSSLLACEICHIFCVSLQVCVLRKNDRPWCSSGYHACHWTQGSRYGQYDV
jgi:hypothetical protein